jgi:hypothetical protein
MKRIAVWSCVALLLGATAWPLQELMCGDGMVALAAYGAALAP